MKLHILFTIYLVTASSLMSLNEAGTANKHIINASKEEFDARCNLVWNTKKESLEIFKNQKNITRVLGSIGLIISLIGSFLYSIRFIKFFKKGRYLFTPQGLVIEDGTCIKWKNIAYDNIEVVWENNNNYLVIPLLKSRKISWIESMISDGDESTIVVNLSWTMPNFKTLLANYLDAKFDKLNSFSKKNNYVDFNNKTKVMTIYGGAWSWIISTSMFLVSLLGVYLINETKKILAIDMQKNVYFPEKNLQINADKIIGFDSDRKIQEYGKYPKYDYNLIVHYKSESNKEEEVIIEPWDFSHPNLKTLANQIASAKNNTDSLDTKLSQHKLASEQLKALMEAA